MTNPLVETVEAELARRGITGTTLIRESYDPQNFGNAEAIYEMGGLYLRFVRDRGYDGVDIAIPGSTEFFLFEDVSLAMGWQKLNEIVDLDGEIDFDAPPRGPVALSTVLGFIRDRMGDLQKAFSTENIASTLGKLKDAQAVRTKAMFG